MKDQLSAMMDGEFEVESSDHIITSVKSGGELQVAWQHYHLIGDAMRGQLGRDNHHLPHDFSARVMQALEAEPTVLAPNKGTPATQVASAQSAGVTRFFKAPFTNNKIWSVAASVAAVMFVGAMAMQQGFNSTEEMAPVEIAQNIPLEYLEAHQSAAPSVAGYYIQNASYANAARTEPNR